MHVLIRLATDLGWVKQPLKGMSDPKWSAPPLKVTSSWPTVSFAPVFWIKWKLTCLGHCKKAPNSFHLLLSNLLGYVHVCLVIIFHLAECKEDDTLAKCNEYTSSVIGLSCCEVLMRRGPVQSLRLWIFPPTACTCKIRFGFPPFYEALNSFSGYIMYI